MGTRKIDAIAIVQARVISKSAVAGVIEADTVII